jgi:hypothetical protein
VRILVDYLLERAPLNDERDEAQAEVGSVPIPKSQPVQLRLDLS